MFGEGGGQVVEGQVGAYYGGFAAFSGNRGANFSGGEEGVGCGSEVLLALQCAVVPGASTWIVGFLEVLPAADRLQLCVEEQVFGIQALFADAVDAPHLIFGIFGGKENLPKFLTAQRPHHKETAIAIADIDRRQFGVVAQRLAENWQHDHAFMAITAVDLLVARQQVDHVANRLVGIAQICLDFFAHLAEQLIAAAEDDVAGLLVVEVPQHHP